MPLYFWSFVCMHLSFFTFATSRAEPNNFLVDIHSDTDEFLASRKFSYGDYFPAISLATDPLITEI